MDSPRIGHTDVRIDFAYLDRPARRSAPSSGMAKYMFDPDEQDASTCYDDCAANRPPLTVDGEPAAGEGIDQALLGTTQRDDGSTQTYNDWPLYRWVKDDQTGEVTGQGVDGVWWVVGPDGTPDPRVVRDRARGSQCTHWGEKTHPELLCSADSLHSTRGRVMMGEREVAHMVPDLQRSAPAD